MFDVTAGKAPAQAADPEIDYDLLVVGGRRASAEVWTLEEYLASFAEDPDDGYRRRIRDHMDQVATFRWIGQTALLVSPFEYPTYVTCIRKGSMAVYKDQADRLTNPHLAGVVPVDGAQFVALDGNGGDTGDLMVFGYPAKMTDDQVADDVHARWLCHMGIGVDEVWDHLVPITKVPSVFMVDHPLRRREGQA